jgi:hypothetical protein
MISIRVAAVAVVVTACSGTTFDTSAATTHRVTTTAARRATVTSATRLDCADPIATLDRPSTGFEVVRGAIALQTARSSSTYLEADPTGAPSTSSPLFAKSGLLVRTGTASTLSVSARSRGRASVEWGNTTRRRATRRLLVPRCPGGGQWIVFPGGYHVRHPACLALDIRSGGRSQRVHVGVGTGCRGQHPPAVTPSS